MLRLSLSAVIRRSFVGSYVKTFPWVQVSNGRPMSKERRTKGGCVAFSQPPSKQWYNDAVQLLVQRSKGGGKKPNSKGKGHAGGSHKSKKQRQQDVEAKRRSAALSTSSAQTGVSFAGAAFQASYFTSKFERRSKLLHSIIRGHKWNTDSVNVASFGGGPGTDVAGLVGARNHANQRFHCKLFDAEPTWKRYSKTLGDLFAPHNITVEHRLCDVTQSLHTDVNRKAQGQLNDIDLFLFFYVCFETSLASERSGHVFYSDLAQIAKPGSVFILADVKNRSLAVLHRVRDTMAKHRQLTPLFDKKKCNADMLAFVTGPRVDTKKT